MQAPFPQLNDGLLLTYTGMETDLLFTQGVDLAGLASYPLLRSDDGRAHFNRYARDLIALGKRHGVGIILEGATRVANRDRGVATGYSPKQLGDLNKQAMALLCQARDTFGDLPTVITANVGPWIDASAPSEQMNAPQAEAYHGEQIETLAQTNLGMIYAYKTAHPAEANAICTSC